VTGTELDDVDTTPSVVMTHAGPPINTIIAGRGGKQDPE
jgi:hypothetical protein